jgi:hypothetical protein
MRIGQSRQRDGQAGVRVREPRGHGPHEVSPRCTSGLLQSPALPEQFLAFARCHPRARPAPKWRRRTQPARPARQQAQRDANEPPPLCRPIISGRNPHVEEIPTNINTCSPRLLARIDVPLTPKTARAVAPALVGTTRVYGHLWKQDHSDARAAIAELLSGGVSYHYGSRFDTYGLTAKLGRMRHEPLISNRHRPSCLALPLS